MLALCALLWPKYLKQHARWCDLSLTFASAHCIYSHSRNTNISVALTEHQITFYSQQNTTIYRHTHTHTLRNLISWHLHAIALKPYKLHSIKQYLLFVTWVKCVCACAMCVSWGLRRGAECNKAQLTVNWETNSAQHNILHTFSIHLYRIAYSFSVWFVFLSRSVFLSTLSLSVLAILHSRSHAAKSQMQAIKNWKANLTTHHTRKVSFHPKNGYT